MFTDDNTEGFSKDELEAMNEERELEGFEPYTTEYYEEVYHMGDISIFVHVKSFNQHEIIRRG